MMNLGLPDYRSLGQTRRWYLPVPQRARVDAAVASDDVPTDVGVHVADAVDDVDVDVEYYRFVGRFLGFSSSWTDNHWGHREEFAPRGTRCNACRWFELRIFRELDVDVPSDQRPDWDELYRVAERAGELGQYVVYKAGMSIAPGEIPYCRYDLISSPHEVVEALTTRKHTDDRGPVAFITKPSALALAVGARYDEDLEDAYVNRAVS